MTEAKDHECKPAQLIPRTPLQFEETVITWLRITSTSKETLMSLSVTFKMSTRKEDSLVCSKDRFVIVGSPTLQTLDIECPSEKTWDIIVLQGTNLYTICGVFISLGRNLAVKSSIEGSPPENNETALHYAVDGILRPGSPCFEVSIDTVNTTTRIGHYFVVLVQKSMKLNRIELYAKRGLPLQVLSIEYVYPIYLRLLTSTPVVYSVDFEVLRLQIDTLLEEQSAFFRFRSNWEEQWSLCEAMFLGDTECPAGKFGVDCHLFCNCLDDEPCLLTGACEHGCKSGFTGFACQSECSSGLYGLGCKTKCSENCKDKQIPCNAVDGFCVGGCDDGYEPPLCFKKCVKGKYGPGCSRLCGQFCKGGYSKCHHVTGVCAEGCEPGAKRPNCEHKCDPHTYGINCEGRCNETCVGKLCDWKTGHCGDCIVGYKGEFCETACSKSWYGLRCSSSCSEYCKDRECYTTNGSCFQCVVGRTGQFCKETCIHGRFGERCSAVCSLNCVGGFRKCNIETGACEEGCEGGYKPPFCNVLIANDTDREIIEIIQQSLITRPMLVFFVGFFGVLCALGIVEAIFLYAMRKRSQRNYKNASKADNEEDIQAPPYGSLVTDVGSPTVTFVDPEEDEVDTTLDQALLLEHLTKVRQYKEYHRSSDSSEDEEAS